MGKAKPISLHPLTFHEALKVLVNVDPDKVGLTSKNRRNKTRSKNQRTQAKIKATKEQQ
ncbi:MAG: hypothetical protein JO108_29800 [Acidobacteriaceae bacterium]|nr:hypothetical protein [Acidobacteriaceae bacterium]